MQLEGEEEVIILRQELWVAVPTLVAVCSN